MVLTSSQINWLANEPGGKFSGFPLDQSGICHKTLLE